MSTATSPIALFYNSTLPPVRFAATEIRRAQTNAGGSCTEHALEAMRPSADSFSIAIAAAAGESASVARTLGITVPALAGEQSYALRRRQQAGNVAIAVFATDAAGAMYGALDVAEALRLGQLDRLDEAVRQPHLARRGIKFNIPLDARTPSYSDNSTAAQANIAEMWSFDFWREFLDEMARHRFNVLSLWSLHPFPSIVRVPEYPDVALNDVMLTRMQMNETYSFRGDDMVRPEMLEQLEIIRHLSIDDKIRFWRDVMQYAADRAIEVYWFTWNIFTFGATGKYGITPAQDNPATIAYFRASVRELVLTYPLLAGIGITAGEQMRDGGQYSKEQWLWAAYGQGILDAKKRAPERKVRLIHRYHETSQSEILEEWKAYPDTFELSFKYSIAHMYSIPDPPFIHDALRQLPADRKLWLTVRNDDVYSFRWADAEYARSYVKAIPQPQRIAGFYMGPDGYCWGREFLSKQPASPRELVIHKQWFSFLLWGRLSYDPNLPAAHFTRILAQRFPEVAAPLLERGWAAASSVFPLITRFFWGDIDLRWFPEACLSHPRSSGFYTVRHFAEGVTMPGSKVLNLRQWRATVLDSVKIEGVSPLEIANSLGDAASRSLAVVAEIGAAAKQGSELARTLNDIEAMGFLAHYYAAKIRGAAELAIFDKTRDEHRRAEGIRILEDASRQWRRYAEAYTRQYTQPVLYNRVGFVDLPGFQRVVDDDVAIARSWNPGSVDDDLSNTKRGDRPFIP
ncbi:MAG: hypothetical protein KIT83_04060 [Bryobacterales bacterium]|nr:hypothetical protein [Bryobacterales bacterium]